MSRLYLTKMGDYCLLQRPALHHTASSFFRSHEGSKEAIAFLNKAGPEAAESEERLNVSQTRGGNFKIPQTYFSNDHAQDEAPNARIDPHTSTRITPYRYSL